jgi:hypothetical protein
VLKQLEAIHIIQTDIDKLEVKLHLSKLPVAAGADFDSHQSELDARCHRNNRVDLLREIYNWADDVDSKMHFFWFKGMAGAGKSTISRTVAQAFTDQKRLWRRGGRMRHRTILGEIGDGEVNYGKEHI